jgi:lipopolysaccharide export system protein LptA
MLPADTARLVCAVLLLYLPASVLAQSADREQPIHIEADSAVFMEKEGLSTYTGNIAIRQGTLELHGDHMTVHISDSDSKIDRIILTGSPATIEQRPEGSDHDLHAEAGQMEYRAAEERIILTGAARIWQADGKEFRSEKIIYNIRTNTVNAGDSISGERVHITLQPKQKPEDNGEPGSE